ncbi:MAG: stage V sporulation protein E [Calditrichia bacterium]
MTEKQDKIIFAVAIALSVIGLIMILSVSTLSEIQELSLSFTKFFKQVVWYIVGISVLAIVSKINFRIYQTYSGLILGVGFFLLILVLAVGSRKQGALRWIDFGFMSFQPIMFVKMAVVIYVADRLSRKRQDLSDYSKGLAPFLIVLLPFLFLIIMQPDYSNAVLLIGVVFIMLLMSPIPVSHLMVTGLMGLIPLIGLILYKPYRMQRIQEFFQNGADLKGSQVGHALIALGSGGFWGNGYAASKMKLFFLQAADTDFIMAILGEEFGLIGVSIVLFLFLVLFIRMLRIISRSQDMFQYYLAIGLMSILFLNFTVNIGVVLNILPTTGVPLPFISYGGSHLLGEFLIIGIMLSISEQISDKKLSVVNEKVSVAYATKKKSKVRTGKIHGVRKY